MKKVLLTLMCLLAMMAAGTSLKAQEVTIVLNPGWTWISCPMMDTLDFATAIGSFTPMQGDIIKSRWGQATYRNGQWMGGISEFYPGYGYHYKSNRQVPVMVTFNLQQPTPQVVVTTSEPTDITMNSAICGGNVASSNGNYVSVTLRGVCWSTNPNPTFNDNYIEAGNGLGSFTVSMTELTPSTIYYVRAFAVTTTGTFYGEELNYITFEGGVIGGHDYVDLGLPSGLLWATCNVGANTPEDYGDYFAWGETQPKNYYDWNTYQYGNYYTLTKYCYNPDNGYNGYTDTLTILLDEDDAAMANWGDNWRTPTKEEWQELYQNTTHTYTTQNGVYGRLFTASNGSCLFLPAAGYINGFLYLNVDSNGVYMSSSLSTNYPTEIWDFGFNSGYCNMGYGTRNCGYSVRAVHSSQNSAPMGAINGKFTINADGGQVYFSQGNLQYQASTSTWRFADNQWDYVGTQTPDSNGNVGGTVSGSDNNNISSTYSGWIDLFGWGTSGYNHGAVCYQPWSTSRSSSDYYAYGSSTFNLYDQTGHADWGYNPISNGGNQENQWRTLTINEWNYVFYSRNTPSGIRFAKANVNGINGVILLPDDWSSSTYSLSSTNSPGTSTSFSSNTISASQWSTLEDAGAVFLPAAGWRGWHPFEVGSIGSYWSATSYYDSACNVHFFYGNISAGSSSSRTGGFSVRVVCSAE